MIFDGVGAQTVDFASPGVAAQRFADLTITNDTGTIFFGSTAVVTDSLNMVAGNATLSRAPLAVGAVMDVRGTLFIDVATFVGLPLRLTSSVSPALQTMSDVVFDQMALDEVQLYVELPGLGANVPASFGNMQFAPTTPGAGAQLETQRFSGADNLHVDVFGNPNLVFIQGPDTVISFN